MIESCWRPSIIMGRSMSRYLRGAVIVFAGIAAFIALRSLVFAQPRLANQPRPAASPRFAVQPTDPRVAARLAKQADLIRPLHSKMGEPKPGEWLAVHKEAGQTFAEFQKVRPAGLGITNKTIYMVAIGPSDDAQEKVMRQAGAFLSIFYSMKVVWLERLPETVIPATAQRNHPSTQVVQFDSIHIVQKLLPPRVPKGAAALVALTATDLWPGNDWYFVFGQGSLGSPTGVVSLYRLVGDKEGDNLQLLRTMKIATHETGHLFGIPHCTAYECCMNGCNSLAETDRHPLSFCPECESKIWLVSGMDPVKRYTELTKFAKEHDFEEAEKLWTKSAEALSD
jgi:archaemetzincin